ncbi:MAG: helix-turn-helix transcriptional regulator [Coriobacteriales bacterium]|nr:helix-turn-helix transcriptional regulator [Coriobacteriales bacterium]
MNPGKKAIGISVKCSRLAHGINQADMAEKVGVTSNTISNWETGLSSIDIDKAWDMADELGMSIDDLVGRCS